jgi:glycosyltransferase involved in cell wall biosynthesis
MKRILYVVHRYYPYPGGSEYYVRNMAEETLKRGYDVWVYSDSHKGDQNGVKVTSNVSILNENFDLIVVHGDCTTQNIVLDNIERIRSPVLYMLIKPGLNYHIINGIRKAKYISYSTDIDLEFIKRVGTENEIVYVPHGILETNLGKPGFKEKYGIKGNMLLSCGGFWPHKGHMELADMFSKSGLDGTLVITGYCEINEFRPKDTENIKTFLIGDYQTILDAIYEANIYIMNSITEGFGLVLLESMLNNTPWASRRVGGANQLQEYGYVYDDISELFDILRTYDSSKLDKAKDFVIKNHTIKNTVDNILKLI